MRRCEEFLDLGYADDNQLLPSLIFFDEACFTFDGYVSNRNVYWWARSSADVPNQLRLAGKEVYSQRVMVWVAVNMQFGLSEPYIFNHTVDQHSYLRCVRDWFIQYLRNKGLDSHHFHFQQDGARCHTTDLVLHELRQHFIEVIGNRGNANEPSTWPPRSPDLSPCDFWLWGRLMGLIYPCNNPRPNNLADLRNRITHALQQIPLAEVHHALRSWRRRLECCVETQGKHFEILL